MSVKTHIADGFTEALKAAGYAEDATRVVLEKPRHKEHGDIATPVAMSLARRYKKNPMRIAEDVAAAAVFSGDVVAGIEVAKPGYINLRLSPTCLVQNLHEVLRSGDDYGTSDVGRGVKCQVEYVSANPTGPLVVVSARAAAVGSVIVNLLRQCGFDAESEYYVNDAGNQVRALGESLRYRVAEHRGTLAEAAELGAYPGAYLKDIAAAVPPESESWETAEYGRFATDTLLRSIEEDLGRFGVTFDNFFRESTLHPGAIDETRRLMEDKGVTYTSDNALFLRTTDLGDEKDRVLLKSDGAPTYFLGDVAYHLTKLRRGYQWVIDLLGPDHHGHIPRMKAAAEVIGADADWLNILIVGWVRLLEGNRPVSMSKRAGEIISMRELIDDVGPDVAKYFFLMRRANTPLDFDLDVARKQSDENPVYYVQYAHARIASITRFAAENGLRPPAPGSTHERLDKKEERDLMVHLLHYPYVVEGAALAREPHRMAAYAQELAALFHKFYHSHRVVTDDAELSASRFFLVSATRQVLKNALILMGVGAPASM